jgi:membrane carboxypeptidase/penicillin-binding protein
VGIKETVRYAQLLGVGSVPSVPSLALGSGEVTLVAMTAAYGAFANAGMLPVPTLIRRVEDADGVVLHETRHTQQRAVSEATAYLMTTMMADVINSGTAWTARREGFTLPAAGKTGTTNDYHDAWFVGYTPKLVAGAWVGYDQPKTIIANGYAAELAVPMWGRFMRTATDGDAADWFRAPKTVTSARICSLSGKLATGGCRDTTIVNKDGVVTRGSLEYTEYFVQGTEPTDQCPIHGSGGMLAALAGWFTGKERAEPVAPAPAPPPAITTPTPSQPPAETVKPPEEPKKKPGFWGRIFGRR